jgi:transcriptional regulator CtsR
MLDYIQKLKKSGLATNQLIHSIKTFVIPHYIPQAQTIILKLMVSEKLMNKKEGQLMKQLEVPHYL